MMPKKPVYSSGFYFIKLSIKVKSVTKYLYFKHLKIQQMKYTAKLLKNLFFNKKSL